jgi:hypothetical protein
MCIAASPIALPLVAHLASHRFTKAMIPVAPQSSPTLVKLHSFPDDNPQKIPRIRPTGVATAAFMQLDLDQSQPAAVDPSGNARQPARSSVTWTWAPRPMRWGA